MLGLELALLLVVAMALPTRLPLERVAPLLAAGVWLLVLAIRALVAIGGAVFVFLYLPRTELFAAFTGWCLHEVLPLLTTHLGLSGHRFAHAAVVLPALVLAASLLSLGVALTRAWLKLRGQLRRSLGRGPAGTTVVADRGVLVAVTSVGRGRIVISPATLAEMDEAELCAGLAHERAHLRRGHRPLLHLARLLAALARVLPGTAAAQRELAFHVERDADEYAVRATRDPLALAGAICKAAACPASPALAPLGGGGRRITRRLSLLVDGPPERGGALLQRATLAVAGVLAALVLGLSATLPGWALAAPAERHDSPAGPCPH